MKADICYCGDVNRVVVCVVVVVAVVFVAVVGGGVVAVSGVIVGGGDNSRDNRIIESKVNIGNVNYLCRCLRYILPSLLAALVVNGSR